MGGETFSAQVTHYIVWMGSPVAVGLHLFGLVLLAQVKGMDVTQRMIIVNLSVTELTLNVLFLLNVLFERYNLSQLNFIFIRLFTSLYYLSTILLTVNRFMRIFLNIRYPLFWSDGRTKWALLIFWAYSVAVAVLTGYFYPVASIYNDLVLDAILVGVAILTYAHAALIARAMIARSRKMSHGSKSALHTQHARIFKGFLLSSMIVGTFVLFVIVPHVLFSYTQLVDPTIYSLQMHISLDILGILSYWSDALIYIFFSPQIRDVLKAHMRKCRRKKHVIQRASFAKIETNL